jgi:hypothetical protein
MDTRAILDTREGPALEKWASLHLNVTKATMLRVMRKCDDLPVPPPESWLGRVDAKSGIFKTSEQVRLFAQVATDNMREVNTSLKTHVPTFALYSLIRAATEASSIGLWLLDAKSEDLAASRTLRVVRQNNESDRTLWKTIVGRHSKSHDERAAEAQSMHDALKGIHRSNFEVAVKSTAVIAAVDARHPCENKDLDVFPGLQVWRLCSAVSHANQVSLMNILERHPDAALGQAAMRTSRLSYIVAMHSSALHRSNLLIDTYLQRSRPRRSQQ